MARKRGLFSTGTASAVGAGMNGLFNAYKEADERKTRAAQRDALAKDSALKTLEGILSIEKAASPVTTTVFDPTTGKSETRTIEGAAPGRLRWLREQFGVPVDEPGTITPGIVKSGGGGTGRGSVQQSQFADEDGTPLLFDRDNRRYVRSDNNQTPKKVVPLKGNATAIQDATISANLLPNIDKLFGELESMGSFKRRMTLAPGVSSVAFPQLNQMKNLLTQTAFAVGGKQLTEGEKKVTIGAFIPDSLDNDESIAQKKVALKGFLEGRIDLSQAANLLGPAGKNVQAIIQKYKSGQSTSTPSATPPDETPEQRKARLISEAQGI